MPNRQNSLCNNSEGYNSKTSGIQHSHLTPEPSEVAQLKLKNLLSRTPNLLAAPANCFLRSASLPAQAGVGAKSVHPHSNSSGRQLENQNETKGYLAAANPGVHGMVQQPPASSLRRGSSEASTQLQYMPALSSGLVTAVAMPNQLLDQGSLRQHEVLHNTSNVHPLLAPAGQAAALSSGGPAESTDFNAGFQVQNLAHLHRPAKAAAVNDQQDIQERYWGIIETLRGDGNYGYLLALLNISMACQERAEQETDAQKDLAYISHLIYRILLRRDDPRVQHLKLREADVSEMEQTMNMLDYLRAHEQQPGARRRLGDERPAQPSQSQSQGNGGTSAAAEPSEQTSRSCSQPQAAAATEVDGWWAPAVQPPPTQNVADRFKLEQQRGALHADPAMPPPVAWPSAQHTSVTSQAPDWQEAASNVQLVQSRFNSAALPQTGWPGKERQYTLADYLPAVPVSTGEQRTHRVVRGTLPGQPMKLHSRQSALDSDGQQQQALARAAHQEPFPSQDGYAQANHASLVEEHTLQQGWHQLESWSQQHASAMQHKQDMPLERQGSPRDNVHQLPLNMTHPDVVHDTESSPGPLPRSRTQYNPAREQLTHQQQSSPGSSPKGQQPGAQHQSTPWSNSDSPSAQQSPASLPCDRIQPNSQQPADGTAINRSCSAQPTGPAHTQHSVPCTPDTTPAGASPAGPPGSTLVGSASKPRGTAPGAFPGSASSHYSKLQLGMDAASSELLRAWRSSPTLKRSGSSGMLHSRAVHDVQQSSSPRSAGKRMGALRTESLPQMVGNCFQPRRSTEAVVQGDVNAGIGGGSGFANGPSSPGQHLRLVARKLQAGSSPIIPSPPIRRSEEESASYGRETSPAGTPVQQQNVEDSPGSSHRSRKRWSLSMTAAASPTDQHVGTPPSGSRLAVGSHKKARMDSPLHQTLMRSMHTDSPRHRQSPGARRGPQCQYIPRRSATPGSPATAVPGTSPRLQTTSLHNGGQQEIGRLASATNIQGGAHSLDASNQVTVITGQPAPDGFGMGAVPKPAAVHPTGVTGGHRRSVASNQTHSQGPSGANLPRRKEARHTSSWSTNDSDPNPFNTAGQQLHMVQPQPAAADAAPAVMPPGHPPRRPLPYLSMPPPIPSAPEESMGASRALSQGWRSEPSPNPRMVQGMPMNWQAPTVQQLQRQNKIGILRHSSGGSGLSSAEMENLQLLRREHVPLNPFNTVRPSALLAEQALSSRQQRNIRERQGSLVNKMLRQMGYPNSASWDAKRQQPKSSLRHALSGMDLFRQLQPFMDEKNASQSQYCRNPNASLPTAGQPAYMQAGSSQPSLSLLHQVPTPASLSAHDRKNSSGLSQRRSRPQHSAAHVQRIQAALSMAQNSGSSQPMSEMRLRLAQGARWGWDQPPTQAPRVVSTQPALACGVQASQLGVEQPSKSIAPIASSTINGASVSRASAAASWQAATLAVLSQRDPRGSKHTLADSQCDLVDPPKPSTAAAVQPQQQRGCSSTASRHAATNPFAGVQVITQLEQEASARVRAASHAQQSYSPRTYTQPGFWQDPTAVTSQEQAPAAQPGSVLSGRFSPALHRHQEHQAALIHSATQHTSQEPFHHMEPIHAARNQTVTCQGRQDTHHGGQSPGRLLQHPHQQLSAFSRGATQLFQPDVSRSQRNSTVDSWDPAAEPSSHSMAYITHSCSGSLQHQQTACWPQPQDNHWPPMSSASAAYASLQQPRTSSASMPRRSAPGATPFQQPSTLLLAPCRTTAGDDADPLPANWHPFRSASYTADQPAAHWTDLGAHGAHAATQPYHPVSCQSRGGSADTMCAPRQAGASWAPTCGTGHATGYSPRRDSWAHARGQAVGRGMDSSGSPTDAQLHAHAHQAVGVCDGSAANATIPASTAPQLGTCWATAGDDPSMHCPTSIAAAAQQWRPSTSAAEASAVSMQMATLLDVSAADGVHAANAGGQLQPIKSIDYALGHMSSFGLSDLADIDLGILWENVGEVSSR